MMQTKVLSMNINCCEKCPKILKKKLLKMPGVDSVAIDLEKDVVLVTGTVDAMTLVNNVAKLGKTVHLLPTNKPPKNKNNHVHEKHMEISDEEAPTIPLQKGKMHKNCCCRDGRHSDKKKVEEHKCEAYVPAKVDERICRDYYCKVHPKSRKIVDKVPAESSALFGAYRFTTVALGEGFLIEARICTRGGTERSRPVHPVSGTVQRLGCFHLHLVFSRSCSLE
ncbi:UNVERIFIED_CONTAM: hypothetical protein Sradi_6236100 [Sesamum radiatum]|uniref:HMA domain-containing protein n=1 Tax=Sesamum radiatum TaxID=300843 RepID=A0AAW2K9P7_SESRA